jgi:ribosomal protein L37E
MVKEKYTLRDEIDGKPAPQYHGTCSNCGREYQNNQGIGQMTCTHCGHVNFVPWFRRRHVVH